MVVEEAVEDAEILGEPTAEDAPAEVSGSDAGSMKGDEDASAEAALDSSEPTASDAPDDADSMGSDDTDTDVGTDQPETADNTDEQEAIPEAETVDAPTPPAPQVTVQKVGFVPLFLGGVIAAVLGFGVAWYFFSQQNAMLTDRISAQNNQISTLEAQIAALPQEPTDLAPMAASVAALSAQVDEIKSGIATDVAAFEERVTAVERAPGVDGTLAATAIASWEQELDVLRAEIAAQQGRMQTIASTAEADLEATRAEAIAVEQSAEQSAQQAIVRAALARVQVALESGTPFDAALADLVEAGTEAPAALSDVAAEGVPTVATLNEAFPDAARAALSAARASGDADADANPITAFLRNQFDVRSVAPRDGDDPDAILSRAGAALGENRLTDALAEIEGLPEVSRAEMSDWLGQATARTAAVAAVETLDQSMNN